MQKEVGDMKKIGILSIQGGIVEHFNMLNTIHNVQPMLVKNYKDLDNIHGLILPGGESTAIGKLLRDYHLLNPIRQLIQKGLPVWGTCAGMVLLASKITDEKSVHLGVMNIEVKRNAYGNQNASFETEQVITEVSPAPLPLVFIRAPFVVKTGNTVQILSTLDDKVIACKQQNMLATSFHPELTDSNVFHEYFVNMVKHASSD